MFPFVNPGGLYVVEDLQTAYWPRYGGAYEDLVNADTSMGMIKTLVDSLHYEVIPGKTGVRSYADEYARVYTCIRQ